MKTSLIITSMALLLPGTAAAQRVHRIRSGESIWSVASRHGCSQEQLMQANRARIKDPRMIQIGEPITIPRCSGRRRGKQKRQKGLAFNCGWTPDHVQVGKLKKLMKARGFKPPPRFRALVVETTLNKSGSRIRHHRLWSWGKRATTHRGWNPASTVKLYSAISALEQVRWRGLGVNTVVTFHYRGGDRSFPLKQLFEEALNKSWNVPHNRLVQLAGFEYLNGPGGTLQRAGLEHTYIMAAYAQRRWKAEGHSPSLRHSPRITLRQGRRKRVIPARRGRSRYPCMGSACTSLSDLAKTMCRMMLHEQLPAGRRLRLGDDGQSPHLKMLRQAMDGSHQRRQNAIWKTVSRHFPARAGFVLFHKPGFSRGWMSENIYIYNSGSRRRWIITLAGYPGRGCLTGAARVISKILRAEAL